MFEKIWGNEKSEITEPTAPAETQEAVAKRVVEIDPNGVVLTRKETADRRKENLEDPTRRYDLK